MRKKWHELNKIYATDILFLFLCCLEKLPFLCKRFPMLDGLQPTSGGNRRSEGNSCRFPKRPPQQNNRIMEEMILSKLETIERYSLLAAKNVLTIDDVAVLTGMSKSHLYKLTCSRQIPFYRPNGKIVYFDRAELEGWLKQNRVTPEYEAEQQAIAYVMTHKK